MIKYFPEKIRAYLKFLCGLKDHFLIFLKIYVKQNPHLFDGILVKLGQQGHVGGIVDQIILRRIWARRRRRRRCCSCRGSDSSRTGSRGCRRSPTAGCCRLDLHLFGVKMTTTGSRISSWMVRLVVVVALKLPERRLIVSVRLAAHEPEAFLLRRGHPCHGSSEILKGRFRIQISFKIREKLICRVY